MLGACAQKRPVLYPNDFWQQVGEEAAQADVEECFQLAEEYEVSAGSGGETAKDTAKGAEIGAATGAATGAVFGSAGRGAASGAVAGATAALARRVFRSDKPDPVFRQFVDRCLLEKGHESIGWK